MRYSRWCLTGRTFNRGEEMEDKWFIVHEQDPARFVGWRRFWIVALERLEEEAEASYARRVIEHLRRCGVCSPTLVVKESR